MRNFLNVPSSKFVEFSKWEFSKFFKLAFSELIKVEILEFALLNFFGIFEIGNFRYFVNSKINNSPEFYNLYK